MILKYVARAAAPETPALYGSSALDACTIDQWLDFCDKQFVSGPGLEAAVGAAGEALALRTFMVGHRLSIADLCGWGRLQTAAMWVKVRNAPAAANVRRWHEFCAAQPPLAAALDALAPKKSSNNAKVRGHPLRGGVTPGPCSMLTGLWRRACRRQLRSGPQRAASAAARRGKRRAWTWSCQGRCRARW